MGYTIPFTNESVKKELCGRSLVSGCMSRRRVRLVDDVVLGPDSGWFVQDGVLHLVDERGSTTFRINAVETERQSVYLSGECFRAALATDDERAVLYEKKELGHDFQIVISSHVLYEEDTVPRLVRSLKREGFTRNRILVVVGGSKQEDVIEKDDYVRIGVEVNHMGFTGLYPIIEQGALTPTERYVLLLHDTCEAATGFADAMSQVDVGLPSDFIGMASLSGYLAEIGLWSTEFLLGEREKGYRLEVATPHHLFSTITGTARLMRTIGWVRERREKDVYGTGNRRRVLEYPDTCLKKYSGADATGGKP